MAVSADGVKQLISFVAWAGFTFSSHYSGKLWFNSRQGDSLQKTLILTVNQLATGITIGLVTCLLKGKLKEVKLDPITFLLGVCLSYSLRCSLYNLIVPIKTTLLIIFFHDKTRKGLW